MSIFIYSDSVSSASEIVSGVRAIGQESILLAIGGADSLINAGADRVVTLKGGSERPEDYAGAIAKMVVDEKALMFLASSTVHGRELAASVAGILECAMFSDVSELSIKETRVSTSRTVFGGSVVSQESCDSSCVATVASGAFEVNESSATSEIEERAVEVDGRVLRVSEDSVPKGGVDLTKADRIVAVGLGLDKQEDLVLVQGLTDALGAGLGCTRDFAESRGWLPKEQYIGITGVIAKPSLYVGVGLSGAMQHVFGIRDAKVIVGINKDKNAAIFRSADYGIVGDLYEIVPKLTAAIQAL